MALAYLSFTDVQNGKAQFYADGGVNKLYRYVIGKSEGIDNGIGEIEEVTHTSQIFENQEVINFSSRFLLQVPISLFRDNSRYLQLITFIDGQGNSPQKSGIVRVNIGANLANDNWPLVQQQNKIIKMQNDFGTSKAYTGSRSIGFAFQESKVSKALFWNSILDAARLLVPIASNLLGSGPSGAGSVGTGAAAPSVQTVMPILQAIMNLIRPASPSTTPASPVSSASSLAYSPTKSKLNYRHPLHVKYNNLVDKSLNYSHAKFLDGALITGPMLAAIAGPILQILPSLMNQQNQARNQRDLQEQNYLANLLAQSNQADIMRLLANNGALGQPPASVSPALPVPAAIAAPSPIPASGAVSTAESLSKLKQSEKIFISVDKQNGITVNGNVKYVYKIDGKISLSILVSTNLQPPARPLPKAIVSLIIKRSEGLKVVLEKKIYLKNVYLNSMQLLEIYREELQNLPLQEDLIVDIDFKWLNKRNEAVTCPTQTCIIFLVNNHFMKEKIGKVGDIIPLNDLNKFKVFWNKIWESNGTDRRKWQGNFSVKYYTYFNHNARSNGKIETRILLEESDNDSSRRSSYKGKLKSGLEISPYELNRLIPQISTYPMLDEERLKPFVSNILRNNFNKQAIVNVELKGNKDEIGSLWTYPEVSMSKYIIYRTSKSNENGQVVNIEEEEVYFPELNTIHFLGLKTAQIN